MFASPPAGAVNLLVILIESPDVFLRNRDRSSTLALQAYVEQLLHFVRSYGLFDDTNQLAVFEVGGGHTALLYSSPGCHAQPVTSGQPQKDAATVLLHRIQGTTLQDSSVSNRLPASWSSALLRALCFIHKVRGESDRRQGYTLFNARILSITTTSDDASQYLAVMNAIFAAQRENILIDACVLGQQNSSFMQQACYLTNGIYLKPSRPEALVQYLLTAYASDASSREYLRLPPPPAVDFRASCFCHKRPVALGYVCSICLSIFCSQVPRCTTCGTDFPVN